jgi:pimeloyl-ACP methyl ester carboxylesterase
MNDRLRDIAVPTRLVLGADDLWVRRELVERTASAIDGADFEYLDGIGHYPMQEWPEFADELDAWLRARGGVA